MREVGSYSKAALIGVAVALLLTANVVLPLASAAPSGAGLSLSRTLVDRGTIGAPSSQFFAVVGHTSTSSGFQTDTSLGKFLNGTPTRFVRYGEDVDQCDYLHNVEYNDSGKVIGACKFNFTALKAWCDSVSPMCVSIVTLPGEIDNVSYDVAEAKYVVQTLGFQPSYWAFGNEPDNGWTHYNVPWTKWAPSQHLGPTPSEYASEVLNGSLAIRAALGASQKTVGIEAASPSNASWYQSVAKTDGGVISAIAFHDYPTLNNTPTVQQYLGTLDSSTHNLTHVYDEVRTAYLSGCSNSTCRAVAVQVGEYNGGPPQSAPALDSQFAGALFTSASVGQAIEWHIPALTYFELQGHGSSFGFAFMNSSNSLTPAAVLEKRVLTYLHPPASGATVQVHNTSVNASNFWSVMETTAAGTQGQTDYNDSLLLVNANLTQNVTVTITPVWPTTWGGYVINWTWPGTSGTPTATGVTSFASSYLVPPKSLLLLNALHIVLAPSSNNSTSAGMSLRVGSPLSDSSPSGSVAAPMMAVRSAKAAR